MPLLMQTIKHIHGHSILSMPWEQLIINYCSFNSLLLQSIFNSKM